MSRSAHQIEPQDLDPGRAALDGVNLIEASAGTGKTYNITALFLRALLQFRDCRQELGIPNVLVVTFTEAATQELRERIRSRLREAISALATGRCADSDAFLQGLIEAYPDEAGLEAARYLTGELRRFDEASIFTIHGFCQRVLQENSFEAGGLFELELSQDDRGLYREAAEDVWRQRLPAMEREFAVYLADSGVTPAKLAEEARKILAKPDSQLFPPVEELPGTLAAQELGEAYASLRELWRSCHQGLLAQIRDIGERYAKSSPLVTRPEALIVGLHGFFAPREFGFNTHDLRNEGLKYLSAGYVTKVKKAYQPPEDTHGFYQACEDFVELADRCRGELELRLQVFRRDFYQAVGERLDELKRRRQLQGFDDLLLGMRAALRRDAGLAEVLRSRYPVALIDEFQDTDPVQYEIFETIYREGGGALFMIGDPKQAIYGFRGGDIYTYVGARNDADPGRAYTLRHNRRSVRSLVQAVNALFEHESGESSFGAEIDYLPVEAAGQAADHQATLDGEPLAPFRLIATPPLKAGAARRMLARHTAFQIADLLTLGQQERLLLEGRPVRPSDIAVLVRKHEEGRAVKAELAACGVRAVEYSQASVFDSEEALELELLLRAVIDPGSRSALPTALATTLMGEEAGTIRAVRDGEAEWELWYQRFLDYQELWRERGVAAMLQHWLYQSVDASSARKNPSEGAAPTPDARSPAERLAGCEGGERRLTNLLHLIEILQETAGEKALGLAGLVKWLSRQRDPELRVGEARELRLESDEALVKIVTVHKSKGLQYPIVFCPFLWGQARSPQPPFAFHYADGEDGRRVPALELGSKALPDYQETYKTHFERAKVEADDEETRLLYVALTRAQYLCYVAFGRIGGRSKLGDSAKSALGRRLNLPEEAYVGCAPAHHSSADPMIEALAAYAAAKPPGLFAVEAFPRAAAHYAPPPAERELEALPFTRRLRSDWSIASYSSLARGGAQRELLADDERLPAVQQAASDDFFGFTRGPHAGSFLHDLLETQDFTRVDPAELSARIDRLAPRYGIDAAKWKDVLLTTIPRVLATPLRDGLSLSAIPIGARLAEMEFHFPLGPGGLMAWLERQGVAVGRWKGALRRLADAPPAGLMKGFIDLVFRHDGRYYLADYKSNHLGDRYQDYSPERLRAVVAEESFDLQQLIYTLALHRYLSRRLTGYDYERDFGGVFYLFLRGMHPEHHGGGICFERPDKALIEALDEYFAGGRK